MTGEDIKQALEKMNGVRSLFQQLLVDGEPVKTELNACNTIQNKLERLSNKDLIALIKNKDNIMSLSDDKKRQILEIMRS